AAKEEARARDSRQRRPRAGVLALVAARLDRPVEGEPPLAVRVDATAEFGVAAQVVGPPVLVELAAREAREQGLPALPGTWPRLRPHDQLFARPHEVVDVLTPLEEARVDKNQPRRQVRPRYAGVDDDAGAEGMAHQDRR